MQIEAIHLKDGMSHEPIEYGIIDDQHNIAIVPDHYVTWLYKIKISKKRRKITGVKIVGLFVGNESIAISGSYISP